MINRSASILFSAAIALTLLSLGSPRVAHAELDACGGIFLQRNAACEYRPKEQCMTQCMTVAVEQSCVAQVYNECETSCTTTASTECANVCTTSCVDHCTTMTTASASIGASCSQLCVIDCESDGGGYCDRATHRGACGRCAAHNCDKRCEQQCGASAEVKISTVTECMPTCTQACSASCTAKVNTQCQVDCQERTYTQCEQAMVEQCQTECKDAGGAIFCDGQFVNANNTDSCADQLVATLDIDIRATIYEARDATQSAVSHVNKKIDKACAVGEVGAETSSQAYWLAPLAGVLVALRIGRKRSSRAKRATRDAGSK